MPAQDASHRDLHSEQGGRPGEHPGRARNPVITVHDVAWLEFEKPDLARAERFARSFGFVVTLRTPDELHLRGTRQGAPCVLVRRGARSRFVGPTFLAEDSGDLTRLAAATGSRVELLPEVLGGRVVELRDPSGLPVRSWPVCTRIPSCPGRCR